ncbi:TetR/AcrR family transcriptional regulator [Ktedonospora formicarum]|uniref:TetR family transcriptional regulator n=1 Tax=Ktedonospora formicarum TaxID=2778364 RepID=A0A8J3MVR8_9CHLR|nr:TetR/AcrR family transcriptional regulator [Ktedonospora formicarum]GHO49615.1 TetR family transcriptional regulator [Ktedonospora formicarum]
MSGEEQQPNKERSGPLSARRRSQQAHDAILRAALTILEQRGYAALSIESIAALAGVGKQTIYRWWPSKAAVVLEAFAKQAALDNPLPDNHTLHENVLAFLETTFRLLNEGAAKTVRGLMAEAQLDPAFGEEFRRTFIHARRQSLLALLERGAERGELAPNTDLELLLDMFYGPMWYRLLNQHAPLNNAFARQLTDFVLRQARDE